MSKKLLLFVLTMCNSIYADVIIPDWFNISFSDGMSNFAWYRDSWTKTEPGWALASELYTQFIVNDLEYSETPRIPKIIHQIWIGSPLPEDYLPLIKTWQELHPDWEYILWDDVMIEGLDLVNKAQYDASTNYGQKADIARYEILYRFGGVYVDIDFECLQPFDIFHHVCDYYTGAAYSGRFSTFNGLIGSVPGNPILQECIETLDINAYYEGSTEHNILFTSGPFHQTRCFIAKAAEAGRAVAFPVNYFYPWPFSHKDNTSHIEQWFKPETYAVHYWHANWREKKGAEALPKKWFLPCNPWTTCYEYDDYCCSFLTCTLLEFLTALWDGISDIFADCDGVFFFDAL